MGLFKKYINQTGKPEGFLGKMMLNSMNSGHSQMADWGMSFLKDIYPAEIADLGCGGGRNAAVLLRRYPMSKMTAVDHSALSVEKASEYNRDMIKTGRCTVLECDVSALQLENDTYELVTAFETIYFWPGLEKCFREVFRILKPGGTFLIVNESDGTDKTALRFEKMIDGMKCYTADTIENALISVGFCEVNCVHHPSGPWITVLAKKR